MGDAGNGIASRASREAHWKGNGAPLRVYISFPKYSALGIYWAQIRSSPDRDGLGLEMISKCCH
jgi:hypothetical protein